MEVHWDVTKNDANRRKHDLSFEDASELFRSGDYLELFDEVHSTYEDRFIAIGPILRGVIVVVFTEIEDEVVRIISARAASKREIALYQKHGEGRK